MAKCQRYLTYIEDKVQWKISEQINTNNQINQNEALN